MVRRRRAMMLVEALIMGAGYRALRFHRQGFLRHSGLVRKHQTRNLEIPGSTLRIAPE
jgi:hypothetical protein